MPNTLLNMKLRTYNGSNKFTYDRARLKMRQFPELENNQLYHVVIISNVGSRYERKGMNGLAHLAEHTCIAPIQRLQKHEGQERKITFIATGMTCYHYSVLYYAYEPKWQNGFSRLFKEIADGSIATWDNVLDAKKQVTTEIMTFGSYAERNRQIVEFVTENEHVVMPLGDKVNIESLDQIDIKKWIAHAFSISNSSVIGFFDRKDLMIQIRKMNKQCQPREGILFNRDKAINVKCQQDQLRRVQAYFPFEHDTIELFFKQECPRNIEDELFLLCVEEVLKDISNRLFNIRVSISEKSMLGDELYISILISGKRENAEQFAWSILEKVRLFFSHIDYCNENLILTLEKKRIELLESCMYEFSTQQIINQGISAFVEKRPCLCGEKNLPTLINEIMNNRRALVRALSTLVHSPCHIVIYN